MTDEVCGPYRVQRVYGQASALVRQEIIAFWRRNQALPAGDDGQRRSAEVFYVARNAADQIVGISSVYVADFRAPGNPHYFYRTFIQPSERHTHLARYMWRRTSEVLEAEYVPGSPRGLVMVIENPRLVRPLVQRRFRAAGFSPVGTDHRGNMVLLKRLAPDR
jgi:hypothetical protein